MDSESCGGSYLCFVLYVNGVDISHSCSVHPNSAGTAVTVRLNAADTVWIATRGAAPCQTLNYSIVYNKFAGHLVYQII